MFAWSFDLNKIMSVLFALKYILCHLEAMCLEVYLFIFFKDFSDKIRLVVSVK